MNEGRILNMLEAIDGFPNPERARERELSELRQLAFTEMVTEWYRSVTKTMVAPDLNSAEGKELEAIQKLIGELK